MKKVKNLLLQLIRKTVEKKMRQEELDKRVKNKLKNKS